ncbi:unnamed protein product [Pieris brassicae]|uniref:ubiquitinyl hydrolase 1 n=1 Tax=Pieris brassicae TaxID=7116 RepID=A0A9P0XAQ5_PIEBR|nr:unnamed protein product [Pieris brassicae]
MGVKDSKPSFISYEDATKRVSDSELRRIREAFKRCAGANGTALSLDAFIHEVLCDGVPHEVAEWLYQACGGTKRGIAFKDLLCGVVVLTKGNIEEKIKFLWTLYVNNQSENGTYIYKKDFARALHLETTSLPQTNLPRTGEILTSLFGTGERVTFEQFRSWLLIHKDATILSKWLLYDRGNHVHDLETPTFYQSLAGVTHLEERDIIELEKCFWSLRNSTTTGELDANSLQSLLSPPLPKAAVTGFFLAFDENKDGHIDFKELCCGLSAACRGPQTERLKFCFKVFDLDRDGVLNKKELIDMVGVLCTVANESIKNQGSRASTPSGDYDEKGFDPETILLNLKEKLVTVPKNGKKPMFQLGPTCDGDIIMLDQEKDTSMEGGCIASDVALAGEDFLIWSVESAQTLVGPFLELVFELCHIVLGLRPHCKHHERDIVLGWLRRETCRGLSVGQFWYLVSAEWWSAWLLYTSGPPHSCCRNTRAIDDAIVCDDSFTTNSTESMGSLMWRAETASVCSAGSSSGVSSAPPPPPHRAHPHPGHVDNSRLLAPNTLKVRTLTGEGGHLRRDVTLSQHRDFELLPDALWRAVALWYGGPDPLPRQVIRPVNSDVELELYPLQLKILRHVPHSQRSTVSMGGMGAGSIGVGVYGPPVSPAPPDRHLAYTAAFSRLATVRQVTEFLCQALGLAREDVRLWSLSGDEGSLLLDDERPTLQALGLAERAPLLLEVRNPDLTWPEEIGALSSCRVTERRETLTAPELPGATGLHNLGNTCFMNAALQAVWNTGPLRRYFNSGLHLYEVNTANPLGTGGALAVRYGELCKEVWSSGARSVAPLRVRWCVSRWARALAGGGQHDAQELLAWLLDALHEDLNRATAAPTPAPTPDATPAPERRPDEAIAAEAWQQYEERNASIMTDLFYGQLKSRVRCSVCGRESVRFDTFNMLSLPLPMEAYVRAEVKVILLDGSVPVKYGMRINSEGTYLDLKKSLSELCGLPPESMLLVLLAGSRIGQVLEDGGKVSAGSACDIYAYEVPPAARAPAVDAPLLESSAGPSSAEVSDASRAAPSGLCMPALFCFKRSRSEILMSQSPPGIVYGERRPSELRSRTLPRLGAPELRDGRETLGGKFPSSPTDMNKMGDATEVPSHTHYLIAVHRKQSRSDAYFLPWQRSRAALFGVPVVVGVRTGACGRDVYAAVWTQLARLLSARPPATDRHNHATDCDDSLGYEFPFTLRVVNAEGAWCARCGWPALCRGCALPCDDTPLMLADVPAGVNGETPAERSSHERTYWSTAVDENSSPIARAKLHRQASGRLVARPHEETESEENPFELSGRDFSLLVGGGRRHVMLAIDWDPTALHLRYQTTREKACAEHASVAQCRAAAGSAVDLGSCLGAFTSEERLEQRYQCSNCRTAQPATKKLQIWRAPPVLIVHLKRFQYVNNKWIKSQKVVNFPFHEFDPTPFLASVPQETILRHRELGFKRKSSLLVDVDDPISESETEDDKEERDRGRTRSERKKREPVGRKRLESSSLVTTPVLDDNLVDYHRHHLVPEQDPFDLKYRLYAVVSHTGQLSGGHYVAYVRHPSGTWLCYNDSSCRELPLPPGASSPHVDPAAAYLLFYERHGLNYNSYLPDVAERRPLDAPDALDPQENDLRKMCTIA